MLLEEGQTAQDPAAGLVGVLGVTAGRQRGHPHLRDVEVPGGQRGQPALVGGQQLLDQLELLVEHRQLAGGGGVQLGVGDDLPGDDVDHHVPGDLGGEVEQQHAEAPGPRLPRLMGQHVRLRRLLQADVHEPGAVPDQAGFDGDPPDLTDLVGSNRVERVRLADAFGGGHTCSRGWSTSVDENCRTTRRGVQRCDGPCRRQWSYGLRSGDDRVVMRGRGQRVDTAPRRHTCSIYEHVTHLQAHGSVPVAQPTTLRGSAAFRPTRTCCSSAVPVRAGRAESCGGRGRPDPADAARRGRAPGARWRRSVSGRAGPTPAARRRPGPRRCRGRRWSR